MVPNAYLLFLVNLVVVGGVVLFATGVVVVLLRRADERRLQEQKLAAVGTATARILHQIKNPLQTILLHSELLEDPRGLQTPEDRRELCHAIIGESERLSTMLNELSQWAAGTRRQLSLHPFPLSELVRQFGRRLQSQAAAVAVEVQVDGEVQVLADGYYLQQVLDNLARNAIEAMDGQAGARLMLRLERTAKVVRLFVGDNGPGIAPARLGQIYEPFVSSKGSGMGLGLAIAREIVEGHGGQLEVESEVGRGTTFRIVLPVHVGEQAPAELATHEALGA